MKLLAIETSTSACSVAVFNSSWKQQNQYQMLHKIAPMQQTQHLLTMIHSLLRNASLELKDFNAIAYGCGPGSFTGIRLASSTVQAIGYGLSIPLISVSSLAATAQTLINDPHHQGFQQISVCLDARMNKFYWANYLLNPSGELVISGQETICCANNLSESQLKIFANTAQWCGVGDGWEKYGDQIGQYLGNKPQVLFNSMIPDARAVIDLARAKFSQNLFIDAKYALPVYMH